MSENYIRENNVSNDKQLEANLRKSINDWANNIPHHPYKNLGDKIDIKSIWFKPAYPLQLRSQYEERSKDKKHVPFTSQKIPPRKYHNLSDFNSWDIHLGKVDDFEDSDQNYYVDGSQHIENCHHCHATGSVTCNTCHGKRSITCPICRGSKEVHCSSCGGHGDRQCSSCGGTCKTSHQESRTRQVWVNTDDGGYYRTDTYYETVTRTCSACGGNGRIRCNTCRGTGKVICSRCNGRGKISCPTCGGTGSVQCPICKGEKQLMHYFYIKRVLDYTNQETCVIHDEVWNQFPQFLDEFPNYEKRKLFTSSGESLPKNQLPDGHRLNEHIDKFISKAEKDKTASHPMIMQQLDIFCIDTWEMRYQFKGKEYVMVFTGSKYEVIPGLSPVYEVARQYWEKGLAAKRWGLYTRASKLLTKASKIDVFEIRQKVDYALEEVKEKLNQSYALGSVIAYLGLSFFGAFVSYTYYSEVNYVFDYISFINNPDNFLYAYHPWAQTIFSVCLIYLAYNLAKPTVSLLGHYVPTAILRVVMGALLTVLFSVVLLAVWALLNATGISIIVTLIVWLAVKVLWIIWWVIKIILGLIILAVQVVWGILKWLWGLAF